MIRKQQSDKLRVMPNGTGQKVTFQSHWESLVNFEIAAVLYFTRTFSVAV